MDALYQILGYAIAMLLAIAVRRMRRYRFWRKVETDAHHLLEETHISPSEAAARALIEAQRAQLAAIERSIERGGNGFARDRDITPKL